MCMADICQKEKEKYNDLHRDWESWKELPMIGWADSPTEGRSSSFINADQATLDHVIVGSTEKEIELLGPK